MVELRGNEALPAKFASSSLPSQLTFSEVLYSGKSGIDTVHDTTGHDQTTSNHRSYLHRGIKQTVSIVVSDPAIQDDVSHLASEFFKTAALFSAGKVGVAATLIVYGLDKACPDDSWRTQLADGCLGAAKGQTMKSMFAHIGRSTSFAPTKGFLMGITARSTDVLFDRRAFSDPAGAYKRLNQELDGRTLAVDTAFFLAGEGLFLAAGGNYGSSLRNNRLAAGALMGGSFGFVNGTASEVVRQLNLPGADTANPRRLDYSRIVGRGLLEAGVGAAGASAGMKCSDPAFLARMSQRVGALHRTLYGNRPREFFIGSGQDALSDFVSNKAPFAVATVREVRSIFGWERLGPEQKLLVHHAVQNPDAANSRASTDLIAHCNPEKSAPDRSKLHVFPGGSGAVWMELGPSGRLRLSLGDRPSNFTGRVLGVPHLLDSKVTINAMAPLVIGDPHRLEVPSSQAEWSRFEWQLKEAKRLGIEAITTDVWWGLIEPKPGQFQWSYYDRLSSTIQRYGLKWVPILSFHQCGGNVGDTVNIPVPFWIWNQLQPKTAGGKFDALRFVSEQGNTSPEYIAYWTTDQALPYYERVMRQFQHRYASKSSAISEINISLGPAGELRYPSYNSHDRGSDYPTRGALQAYSDPAVASFRDWTLRKYGNQETLEKAWGLPYASNIGPPENPGRFFELGKHHSTQYGRDFFDWYNESLILHGKKMMGKAIEVFAAPDSPFAGIDLGAKIPGVHWRIGHWDNGRIVLGDRLAELSAGLIRTSTGDWGSDAAGRGYRPLLSMFVELQNQSQRSRIVPHFTCLEMVDGNEGAYARSMAWSLATWVGSEARQLGLPFKGENALAWNLANPQAWDIMRSHLALPGQHGNYQGLTILRLGDLFNHEAARAKVPELMRSIQPPPAAGHRSTTQ